MTYNMTLNTAVRQSRCGHLVLQQRQLLADGLRDKVCSGTDELPDLHGQGSVSILSKLESSSPPILSGAVIAACHVCAAILAAPAQPLHGAMLTNSAQSVLMWSHPHLSQWDNPAWPGDALTAALICVLQSLPEAHRPSASLQGQA